MVKITVASWYDVYADTFCRVLAPRDDPTTTDFVCSCET